MHTLIAIVLALALAHPARAAAPPAPPAAWLLDQVKALTTPEMDGRQSGTPGADLAARHLAAAFQAAGLRPGGDGGGYVQSFSVPLGIKLGVTNTLTSTSPAARPWTLGRDFIPLPVSEDGLVDAEVVFAGHGITAPDLGWDDYAGLDVTGRIVLVLGGEPRGRDPASPFRRPDAYHYSQHAHRIINAREHGARAILLVSHPAAGDDALPALAGLSQSWSILAAAITRGAADVLLAPAGRTLADLADEIDRRYHPGSRALGGARARLEVRLVRERGTAANVVGVLPGTDPRRAGEVIVIGAHYDHLGRGGEGSLAPDQFGTIHPGADDNASGTAAVVALARAFAAAGGTPRTLVFAAFAGEELGLLGSTHYVRAPAHPVDRTALMLNLDMVGRLREGKLYVAGVDSGTGLRDLVTGAAGADLSLDLRGDPYAPSDHTAFYAAGRPVLFLFTGAHEDYHRPGDTWDRINGPGLAAVTAFASRVVAAVAAAPVAPEYVRLAAPPSPVRRGGGYGPFFGVIPEFGESPRPGVKLGGVRAGSPAEQAGLRAGDIIVAFAGVAVRTLADLTFVLRGRRPGDRVEVIVLREGVEQRLSAVLAERRQ
jgi:membrane-associated protease RseP (regulator of RpoE activity)